MDGRVILKASLLLAIFGVDRRQQSVPEGIRIARPSAITADEQGGPFQQRHQPKRFSTGGPASSGDQELLQHLQVFIVDFLQRAFHDGLHRSHRPKLRPEPFGLQFASCITVEKKRHDVSKTWRAVPCF